MTIEGQIHIVDRARLEHCDRQAMRQWLARVLPGTPVALEVTAGVLATKGSKAWRLRRLYARLRGR